MALARWQRTIVDNAGNILPGAQVTVRREVSGAPLAVLYSDRDGTTPVGNPFTADPTTAFAAFHAAGGAHRIDVVSGAFSQTLRYVGIGTMSEKDTAALLLEDFLDFPEIAEPATPPAGVQRGFASNVDGGSRLAVKNSNGDVLELLRIGNVKNYGASPSASAAVNAAAIQAALDATDAIEIPEGTYDLDTMLTATRPKVIEGIGMTLSVLRWTADAASEGIEITPTSDFRDNPVSQVGNLALFTYKDAVGTALKFDYSAFISGGTSVPRATAHAKVYRLFIQGATDYVTDGWANGIDFVSCQACTVDSCRINGHYNNPFGTVPSSDTGISFGGSGAPVQLVVSKSWISAWQVGIHVFDAEGVYVSKSEIVTCNIGFKIENAAEEPLFSFANSHIAGIAKCIEATNANSLYVKGCWLSPIAPQTGDYIGVHLLSGCSDCHIEGNTFIRSNITSLYRGVVVDGADDTLIHGNNFAVGGSVGCIGIDLNAGSVRTREFDNVFSAANVRITDAGSGTILDGYKVIATSAVAVSHTGDTNETALATISIPGGSMGPNGAIRVTALWSMADGGAPGNRTPRIRLGGISGTGFYFVAHASSVKSASVERIIQNRNSQSSQVTFAGSSLTSLGTSTSPPSTGTQVTSGNLDLVLSGQLANAGDTITLEQYSVEVLYRP